MSQTGSSFTEELKISGEQLVEEVKRLVHEGNVRHIVVKNQANETVAEFPVSVGLAGALLLPFYAAVAAIAVVAVNYTLVITRDGEPTL